MIVIEFFSNILNNREIAIAFWISILIIICIFKKGVLVSFSDIIRSLLQRYLLAIFTIYALWVASFAWLGNHVFGRIFEQPTHLVFWYFFAGLPMLFRAFDAKEGSQHFLGYAKSSVSGVVLLEFLYSIKTFSLLTEITLFPILLVLGSMIAHTANKPQYRSANTFSNTLLFIIVLVTLCNRIYQISNAPDEFFNQETLFAFLLPIYLTIASIPYFYGLHCYAHIEGVCITINQTQCQSASLKKYAKRRFIITFMLRPWLLRRAATQFHVTSAKTCEDVDKIINDILQYIRDEKNPPYINEIDGWCPFSARELTCDLESHPFFVRICPNLLPTANEEIPF